VLVVFTTLLCSLAVFFHLKDFSWAYGHYEREGDRERGFLYFFYTARHRIIFLFFTAASTLNPSQLTLSRLAFHSMENYDEKLS
jgi:hypothetical protein